MVREMEFVFVVELVVEVAVLAGRSARAHAQAGPAALVRTHSSLSLYQDRLRRNKKNSEGGVCAKDIGKAVGGNSNVFFTIILPL